MRTWSVTVEQCARFGAMAWYGQVHHGTSTYDGGTYGWTEAGCRRKVLRRMRRLRDEANRRARTRVTIEDRVEASSLGTPAAKAARASVSDERAAQVVARSEQLRRERGDA